MAVNGPHNSARKMLPGEATVDDQLVDRTVREIQRIALETGLTFHLALGTVVLDRFFGGDIDAYRAHGKGHSSFRALAERDDLPVRHSTISNAVRLTIQMQHIPDTGRRLNLTQHRALFPLLRSKRFADLERLAQTAADHGLTAGELKKRVDRVRGKSNVGRPKLPAFQKTLHLFDRVARADDSFEDLDAIEDLEPEAADELLQKLEGVKSTLESVEERLRQRSVEWRAASK